MMATMLNVLLTNDDGFYAEGLQSLFTALRHCPNITVTIVAPDRERSAVGHGITMHQPLRVSEITLDGSRHWSVDGTPSDCVKLALDYLLTENPPDIIISGINRGPNLGNDVLYSGTVSAAIEGKLNNIPSIAVSVSGYGNVHFRPATEFICSYISNLKDLAQSAVLNVNFPCIDSYKGVRFTRLGARLYENVFEERRDPRNQIYFWMGGNPKILLQPSDSDVAAIEEGYVSITPLHFDLTDYRFLAKNNQLDWKD